jgi:zinc/manganese transport system permease protein
MLDYDFMRNAFAAGSIVAIVAGAVGYFLVLRAQAFAGHALGHVGFAGATGAVLLGLDPLWGLLAFNLAAGIGIGFLGERMAGRDVAIGVVLTLSLGLGVLFLSFYTAHATQASALLFGNVLAVDPAMLWPLLGLAAAALLGLAAIARPLLFATLQPELAEARGVPLRLIGVLFMAIVAVAVAEAAQIVGVLLVFALMIGPAAASGRLTRSPLAGIGAAIILALGVTWAGLTLAFYTDWPTSFWISALSALVYLGGLVADRLGLGRRFVLGHGAQPATAPRSEAG